MKFIFSDRKLLIIKSLLFLILLHLTQCAVEPEVARVEAIQAKGQKVANAKNNNIQKAIIANDPEDKINENQSEEILTPIKPQVEENVVPVNSEKIAPVEKTEDTVAVEESKAVEEPLNTEIVNTDTAAEAVNSNDKVAEPVNESDASKNLLESESDLPKKERINLLPEQQSPNQLYGKQVAHVPGNRVNQSPLGGLASMFGGFGRALGGGISANTFGGNGKAYDPEVDRAQKLKSGFEKMIQMVNILGQVDSFLSDRTRSVMRRLSMLADADADDDRYRRSHRRHHY